MAREIWISLSEWAVILTIALVDFILSHTTGIGMDIPTNTIEALAIIVLLWPVIALLTGLTGFAKGSAVIAENAAKFFLFIVVISAFEYYMATNSAPLYDEQLVKVDSWLGFSWPDFFDWVRAHKLLAKILSYFYASLQIQALLVLFAVCIIYPQRANRFITAFLISSLLTMLIFGLIPVAGPFVYFNHTDLPQAYYTEHYLQMRAHQLNPIPLGDIRGIVSFPSFHVSSAVLITYFFRRLPVLFGLAVILNIGMSVSALVIGGHYLSDVLAGVCIGLITIFILQKLQGTDPERRLPLGLRRSKAVN